MSVYFDAVAIRQMTIFFRLREKQIGASLEIRESVLLFFLGVRLRPLSLGRFGQIKHKRLISHGVERH